ncbi:hypothetical protein BY458DRAFT_508327 [Sporodiniella umbellata]|nr:hypothetical protein BY458DRAFT_508327 [Sporodiniella umbellata]
MSLVKTHCASSTDYYPKVQPRSSSERDNSFLLHTALKAASTDMAHRLLNYASLDKTDCEASCILIALANHTTSRPKQGEKKPEKTMVVHEKRKMSSTIIEEEKTIVVLPNKHRKPSVAKEKIDIAAQTNQSTPLKNDPMMLLMAAAEVVEGARDKRKSSEKRISKSSPNYHPRDLKEPKQHNFSRQYLSMKQNPKIKQNALHAYITYMIYNDLAHGSPPRPADTMTNTDPRKSWYSSLSPPQSQPPPLPPTPSTLETKKSSPIISQPLTAFLWNEPTHSERKEPMVLPPLGFKH